MVVLDTMSCVQDKLGAVMLTRLHFWLYKPENEDRNEKCWRAKSFYVNLTLIGHYLKTEALYDVKIVSGQAYGFLYVVTRKCQPIVCYHSVNDQVLRQ